MQHAHSFWVYHWIDSGTPLAHALPVVGVSGSMIVNAPASGRPQNYGSLKSRAHLKDWKGFLKGVRGQAQALCLRHRTVVKPEPGTNLVL